MKNQKRICTGREEGRFSNSKAVPSFLVSLLSSPPPPPSHPICRATCAILHPSLFSSFLYSFCFFFPSQVVRKNNAERGKGPEIELQRQQAEQPDAPAHSPNNPESLRAFSRPHPVQMRSVLGWKKKTRLRKAARLPLT